MIIAVEKSASLILSIALFAAPQAVRAQFVTRPIEPLVFGAPAAASAPSALPAALSIQAPSFAADASAAPTAMRVDAAIPSVQIPVPAISVARAAPADAPRAPQAEKNLLPAGFDGAAAKPADAVFPDPRTADAEGLVTEKLPLTPANIRTAYRAGIFPWTDLGETAGWYSPEQRGVLDFAELHVSKSLARFRRKSGLRVTFDSAFEQVIRACSLAERGEETWISEKFIQAYTRLHAEGHAHSVEVWSGDKLVGGLYGVFLDGVFNGESMFHAAPNAGKIALLELAERLTSKGLAWMDLQMVTDIMASFGAKYIPRDDYLKRLEEAHKAAPVAF